MLIEYQSHVGRSGAALRWSSAFAIRFAAGFALHLGASLIVGVWLVPLIDVMPNEPHVPIPVTVVHHVLTFPTIVFASDPWESTGTDLVIDSLSGGMSIATVWQLVGRGRRRFFYD